jgi:hypothetical protein
MSDRLSLVLLAAVVAAVAVAPSFGDHAASRKSDERLAAVEADHKKVAAAQRSLDARVFHLEEMRDNLQADLARVVPTDARWVELARGGREQWEFDEGGRVQIQFEGWSETGTFGFQMNSRAGETHAEFRPGFSLTAVDDLGDKQRHYTMTLHRVDLERDGRPHRGLVSVVVATK